MMGVLLSLGVVGVEALASDRCAELLQAYRHELDRDLILRDRLSETEVARCEWDQCGKWGPPARIFPPLQATPPFDNPVWLRRRVVDVAKRYLGFAYERSHIPSRGGFDCSNFTAWVYNFGLGINFNSNIAEQAKSAGRLLRNDEPLEPGDLIFWWSPDRTRIRHVIMHVDDRHFVHAVNRKGVVMSRLTRDYRDSFGGRYAFARRLIED